MNTSWARAQERWESKNPPQKRNLNAFDDHHYESSRQDIGPDSAMRVSAVYACVNAAGQTLGMLPSDLMRRLPDGGKEPAVDLRLYEIIRYMPNPEMTAMEYAMTRVADLFLAGNHYSQIVRSGRGVEELWPLNPRRMKVERDPSGKLVYLYRKTENASTPTSIPRDQIHHIKLLSLDGVTGLNPIAQARMSISLSLEAEQFGQAFFKNATRPSGIVTFPAGTKKEDREEESERIKKGNSGPASVGKNLALWGGVTWTKVSIDPVDAQFLDTRKFQVTDVARIYRIPPHKIGHLENATFSNIEMQSHEFITDCIQPLSVLIEQAEYRDLMTPEERKTLFVERNFNALMRGDTIARFTAYSSGRQNGILSPNDCRSFENLPPYEGGDIKTIQLNMAIVDKDGIRAPEAAAQPAPADTQPDEPIDETPVDTGAKKNGKRITVHSFA